MIGLIERHLARLRLMVQFVTGVEIDGDGNATCQGADGEEFAPTVGYHFGFYSRPAKSARGVIIKADGQGNTSFLIAWRDKQYELSLQKGECGVQNAFGASTLWDKNGNVITTPGGSGKVQLGGASGNQPAVLGNTLQTRLADLEAKFLGHVHATALGLCTAGGATGSVASAPTTSTLPHSADVIKSNTVEVKP
jgi:hypothetical protein